MTYLLRGFGIRGVVAGLVLLFCTPSFGQSQQVWQQDFAFSPDGRLAIENLYGNVEVRAWDQPTVRLTAHKTTGGGWEELAMAQVAVEAEAGSLAFRTVFVGETEHAVRVDYVVEAPRGAVLESIVTVEGDIVFRGAEGPVSARTLSGRIGGEGLAGPVAFHAADGDIAVSFRGLPAGEGTLVLETLNGSVSVQLPAGADADLSLETVSGEVHTPYPQKTGADLMERAILVRAGRGGVRIEVRTVRGDVFVSEASKIE